MSNQDYGNNDPHPPETPSRQIEQAFLSAEQERNPGDFKWLVDYLEINRDARLVQFTVYGDCNYGVYMVLHVLSSEFGKLAQELENNEYQVPYQIQVLSRYYGSDKKIDVLITWGPGGGS